MRTKTLGERRKRSLSATHSPITIPLLSTIQDGCNAPLYETSSSESDGNMADCTDQHSNRNPVDVLNHDSMDLLDSDICICCNEGGVVLICSEKGCPVTLHAKCISCEPKFDELGNFFCPFCWYKRAVEKSQELRKKAMIAKKALSTFLDNNVVMTTSNKLVEKDGNDKRKKACVGDGISFDCENQPEGDQPRKLDNVGSDPCEIALEGQVDADGDVRPLGAEEEMPVRIKLVKDSVNQEKFDKPNISESHGTGRSKEKESLETEDPGRNKEDECEKVEKSQELRKKAMLEKKVVSTFLDSNVAMTMSDKLVQKDENAKRKKACVGDWISFGCENQPEGDQPRKLDNVCSDPCEIAFEGQADADGDFRPLHAEEEMPEHIKLVKDSVNREKFDKPNISESHGTGCSKEKESLEIEDPGRNKEDECEKVDEVREEAEQLSASHLGKHADGQSPDIAFAQGRQESVEKSAEYKDRMPYKGKVSLREQKVSSTGSSVSETIDSNSVTITGSQRHGNRKVQRTARPPKVPSVRKSLSHEHNNKGESTGDIYEEVTSSKTLRTSPRSSKYKHINKLSSLPVRRRRLRWTAEEEKALKEGVLRFAKGNETMPWRQILEVYSHVFDGTRTPVDLKDKWRNITSKQGCK